MFVAYGAVQALNLKQLVESTVKVAVMGACLGSFFICVEERGLYMSEFMCIYLEQTGKCQAEDRMCIRRKCEAWQDCDCCENREKCDRGNCE